MVPAKAAGRDVPSVISSLKGLWNKLEKVQMKMLQFQYKYKQMLQVCVEGARGAV